MKGDPALIQTLNNLLAQELAAINQYMVHAEMCDQWGYEKLHEVIEKQAIDEMHHAEWLIDRILFLEGRPNVSRLDDIHIGKSVEEIMTSDEGAEERAVKMYNDGIQQAVQVNDHGTRDLLTKILRDEERHLDFDEQQKDQIQQMGLQNYLSKQM
ncbi:MAG: bacterioferritin [Bacteroidales bacterium]